MHDRFAATGMLKLPSVRPLVILVADLECMRARDVGHGGTPAVVHQLRLETHRGHELRRGPR